MEYDLNNLVKLEKNQITEAVRVLSQAFIDDPLIKWFFPDKSSREELSFSYFRFRIKYGILFGDVYATSHNLEGLAIWFSSENTKMTYVRMMRAGGIRLIMKLGFDLVGKLTSVGNFVSNIHQRLVNYPHLHLSPMGVAPEYQGQGYGSILMRSMLRRLDEQNLPCFLETQNEKNVKIYQHYGFKIIDKTTIPNSTLEHWSMLRNPLGKLEKNT
jgi:ribosomal protein S18 acetylase RimI-like enzyme